MRHPSNSSDAVGGQRVSPDSGRTVPLAGLAVMAVLLVACGARSDLDRGSRREDAGRLDGGAPRPDAGPPDAGPPDAGPPDAGPPPDARPPVCADRQVRLSATSADPSTVILVVDASSSMRSPFGAAGTTRWDAVRAALTGDGGVIRRLEDRVRFGLVRYSGVFMCPEIQRRAAELGAADGIDRLLTEPPGGTTPTAESIREVRTTLRALVGDDPGPVSIVLATDGDPVACDGTAHDPTVRRRVVEQVELAFEESVRTFVLSVGAELSEEHLQDLANAGANVQPGEPDVPAWRADDPAALSVLLAEAVGAAVACVAQLPWEVDDACAAEVRLDGTMLRCAGEPEYEIEGTRLTFRGAACDRWEAGATAVVRPPCE